MTGQKVADVLHRKSQGVVTIEPGLTVHDAIRKLVDHNIGSLVVVDRRGGVVGIITERDILRLCARGVDKVTTPIKDAMTREVIIGVPEDSVQYVMGIMTTNRIRHLPVMDGHDLIGMISIGDVVHAHLRDAEFENRMLRDYIHR